MINTNWFDQAKNKINDSVIDSVPFDHMVIDDFLPIDDQLDFYQKLTNIKSQQANQIYDNKSNGSKLQFNQDIGDPTLSSLMKVFGSTELSKLIKDKFNLDQDLYHFL